MGNRVLKTQQWIDRYKSINSKMKSILEDVQEHWSFEHLCDLIGNRSFGSVEISEEFLMPDSSISDVGILRHVFLEYFFPFMYRAYGSPLYSSGRKTYLLFGLCRDFYTVPNFDLLNIGEDHMDHLFPQYTLRIHREQPQFCDLQMRGQRAVPAYIENESLVTYSVEKTFTGIDPDSSIHTYSRAYGRVLRDYSSHILPENSIAECVKDYPTPPDFNNMRVSVEDLSVLQKVMAKILSEKFPKVFKRIDIDKDIRSQMFFILVVMNIPFTEPDLMCEVRIPREFFWESRTLSYGIMIKDLAHIIVSRIELDISEYAIEEQLIPFLKKIYGDAVSEVTTFTSREMQAVCATGFLVSFNALRRIKSGG